jgi:maleylpyruvate isomerase
MDDGTALLVDRADALAAAGEAAARLPVPGLPGWTHAHLLAHVAYNAEALQRLVRWARTGVETPMYPSPDARATEIEQGSRRPLADLIGHVRRSAADLARALDELPTGAWDARVRTAQGREVPAREIVWMRTREVWVHAVDLDPGTVSFWQFPPDLLDALVADVVAMFARRGQAAGLVIEAVDTGRRWSVAADAAARPDVEAVTVRGKPADLAAWLTGRSGGETVTTTDGRPLPELPAWL